MKKLFITLLIMTFLVMLNSCEKEEEEKECKISFTLNGRNIIASGCTSVTITNIKYGSLGQILLFDYSGCGETGQGFEAAGDILSWCD